MPSLSEPERNALLHLARRSIELAVCRERLPEEIPREGIFSERRGVFVTLHVCGRLRGCIGMVEPVEPLGECLVRSAVSAALQDSRFPPLRAEELPDLVLELSLLTPPEPIRQEEIEIGRHGLLISCGLHRGLLLPQVATQHHLSRERFLEEACRKAGLPTEAWKDSSTEIRAFTCEIVAERGEDSSRG